MAISSPTGMQSSVPAKKMPRSNIAYGQSCTEIEMGIDGEFKDGILGREYELIADQLSKLEQAINEAKRKTKKMQRTTLTTI